MPNSVKTRAITSRCQDEDEDEDEDKELQIIHGSVDGGGAIRSQEASKSTSWTLQGQKSPKVHIISLVSLTLLIITYHGSEVLCAIFIFYL